MKKQFFIFSLFLIGLCLISSCTKKDEVVEPFVPKTNTFTAPTISSVPQVNYFRHGYMRSIIVDGSGSCSVIDTSYYSFGKRKYGSLFTYLSFGYSATNVFLGDINCGLDSLPDSTSFRSYFSIGSKSYANDSLSGVKINILIDGGEYSTVYTSQSGSSFVIEDVIEDKIGQIQRVKILGRFNCNVAKSNGTDIIPLTSGTLVAYFRNK